MESVDQAPGTWLNMVRRMRFNGLISGVAGRVVKLVAFQLAACADYVNGGDVRPGLARIAVECEIDYRTAKRCVAAIRDLGLIRLVRSGSRRGYSDVYQLTMPGDILDRVIVLTPAEMDRAIEEIRDGNRRRPVPSGPNDGPGTGHADPRTEPLVRVTDTPVQPVDNTPVRVTPTPVPAVAADTRTGHADPRTESSTGHAVPQYGSRHAPPPRQSTETTTTTEPTDDDLRTDLTVVADPPSEEDPHSIDEDSPQRCHHGLAAGHRSDGLHACALCRVEARIATHGTAGSDRIPDYADRPHLRLIAGGAA